MGGGWLVQGHRGVKAHGAPPPRVWWAHLNSDRRSCSFLTACVRVRYCAALPDLPCETRAHAQAGRYVSAAGGDEASLCKDTPCAAPGVHGAARSLAAAGGGRRRHRAPPPLLAAVCETARPAVASAQISCSALLDP